MQWGWSQVNAHSSSFLPLVLVHARLKRCRKDIHWASKRLEMLWVRKYIRSIEHLLGSHSRLQLRARGGVQDFVSHAYSIWSQVSRYMRVPFGTGMEQYRPSQVLEVTNALLSHTVRMMSMNTCKCDALSLVFVSLQPLLCPKDTIVSMICFDLHPSRFSVCFKCEFALNSFVGVCRPL